MITGFEVYKYYLGVKLHFISKDYDVIAAGGHTNVGQSAFAKRRDKSFFEGLASKFDRPSEVIKYLIANFAYGHMNVMYDREVGQDLLQRWIKNKESLSRVLDTDLRIIVDFANQHNLSVKLIFATSSGSLCTIIKLYKSQRINVESVSLLCQLIPGLLDAWNQFPESKMLYEADLLRIKKLSSFVKVTPMCEKVWSDFKEENKLYTNMQ